MNRSITIHHSLLTSLALSLGNKLLILFSNFLSNLNREFFGAGRIRTDDLQRPRLASYQARQQPPQQSISNSPIIILDLDNEYID